MRFSVIVPTRNSSATLGTLLDTLRSQTVCPYEILVADGRSIDATKELAARYGAKIIDNPAVHAAGGRNRAAACALGDWLAFTDSDCLVPPQWIETVARAITSDSRLVAVGGPIRPVAPSNEIERVAAQALLDGVLRYSTQQCRVFGKSLHCAFITANAFYRRDAFLSVGGFDERFANYGEDIDLFWRTLMAFPGQLLYEPSLGIEHRFPTTWGSLFEKWFQYGLASCHLQRRHLGRLRIDLAHYRRLVVALTCLLTEPARREQHAARLFQILGHLCGKYWGSLKLGVLNL